MDSVKNKIANKLNQLPRPAIIAAVTAVVLIAVLAIALTVSDQAQKKAAQEEAARIAALRPAVVSGSVLADGVSVTSVPLNRDDQVTIIGEKEDYYLVSYQSAAGQVSGSIKSGVDTTSADAENTTSYFYVEKDLVRPSNQDAPATWTGYVQGDTSLFSSAYCEGTPIASAAKNDQVQVVDTFANVALIALADGTTGYINRDQVSDTEVVEEEEQEEDTGSSGSSDWSYSYSYSYSSNDSSDSSTSSEPDYGTPAAPSAPDTSSSSNDGGDIVLSAYHSPFQWSGFVSVAYADEAPAIQSASSEGKAWAESGSEDSAVLATILSDDTKTYLAWLQRGDVVSVISMDAELAQTDSEVQALTLSEMALVPDGMTPLLLDDQRGYIASNLVRPETSAAYTAWSGYAAEDAALYDTYTLSRQSGECSLNQEITVLDDLGTCYYVQVDGSFGYMSKDSVSAEAYEEPEEDEDDYSDYSYYSYGYSGYSYSSSSGESSSSTPQVDSSQNGSAAQNAINAGGWTEEKL